MKTITCTECGYVVRGKTEDEVMKREMEHIEKAGHNRPSNEQIEIMRASIRDEGEPAGATT